MALDGLSNLPCPSSVKAKDEREDVDRPGSIVKFNGTVIGQRCAGRHRATEQENSFGSHPTRQLDLALVGNQARNERVALKWHGTWDHLVPHFRVSDVPFQPSGRPLRKSTRRAVPASILPIPNQAKAPSRMPSTTSIRTSEPWNSATSQVRSCSTSLAGASVSSTLPLRPSTNAM